MVVTVMLWTRSDQNMGHEDDSNNEGSKALPKSQAYLMFHPLTTSPTSEVRFPVRRGP